MWPKLNTMKHFVTLAALLTSLVALPQNPNYDPDSNGDELIGAVDLTSLLAVYNTSLAVDTTLECNFDGTAEEEWLFSVITGEVFIDSVVVQYSISDSATYYDPGCPTLQVYNLDVEMEYTLFPSAISETFVWLSGEYANPWGSNSDAYFRVFFDSNNGIARWYWEDFALYDLAFFTAPYNADFNFQYDTWSHFACINASSGSPTFTLSEDGLVGEIKCNGNTTDSGPWNDPEYNYFRILPYWHYAE